MVTEASGADGMKRAIANLPLHGGKAPKWLFNRMKMLSGAVLQVIVEEFGPEEVLQRLSDPFWFQAFGCVLGFDWHSSGVTTVVCGAVKESTKRFGPSVGLYVCGGKGGTSRKTPSEIEAHSKRIAVDAAGLVYASRMSAKVDSSALQDGYQIYHHTFLFTRAGSWAVVQQGMNEATGYARRYHWLGDSVRDFVCEPHAAIACDSRVEALNMVARESEDARTASARAACENPDKTLREVKKLQELHLPRRHEVLIKDINPRHLHKVLLSTYENHPEDFEGLLSMQGVGPKTIRSLALISELIYDSPASVRDPARYSFALGGKDGHPYPVDRETYDRSINILQRGIKQARLGRAEKMETLRRLRQFAR
jgi:hypothetical protein